MFGLEFYFNFKEQPPAHKAFLITISFHKETIPMTQLFSSPPSRYGLYVGNDFLQMLVFLKKKVPINADAPSRAYRDDLLFVWCPFQMIRVFWFPPRKPNGVGDCSNLSFVFPGCGMAGRPLLFAPVSNARPFANPFFSGPPDQSPFLQDDPHILSFPTLILFGGLGAGGGCCLSRQTFNGPSVLEQCWACVGNARPSTFVKRLVCNPSQTPKIEVPPLEASFLAFFVVWSFLFFFIFVPLFDTMCSLTRFLVLPFSKLPI